MPLQFRLFHTLRGIFWTVVAKVTARISKDMFEVACLQASKWLVVKWTVDVPIESAPTEGRVSWEDYAVFAGLR